MVVVLIAGVLKIVPVPKLAPPVNDAYQLMVELPLAVAPKATETGPGPQAEPGVVLRMAGLLTVTVTGVEGEAAIGVPPQVMTQRYSVEAVTPVAL